MLHIRFYIFLFFIFSFSLVGTAQNSIEKILEKAERLYDENPAESFSLYEKAERQAIESNNHNFDGEIHDGKGRYLVLIGKYDAATSELNKSILIYKEIGDKKNLASVYSIKSIMLERIGEVEQAHNLLLKALELDKETNNKYGMRARFVNLSLDYYRFEQADSMLYCLEEMESLLNDEDLNNYYYYYQNWGMYYSLVEDFDRAIQQFEHALEVAESEKMTDSKATVLMLLGQGYRKKGDLSKAEDFAQQSYVFSEEQNLDYESSEALLELILIKEVQGNYAEAFKFQKKWVRKDKEINDFERIQKVKIMESQLDVAEKEKEIALGEAALQAEKLAGQKMRTRNAWLVGIVILIVILLGFTAYIYSKTKRLNTEINEQKEQVELKSLKLEDALTSIEDSLNYSKLIQESMLPSISSLKPKFKNGFVLYKPKDIVSGDFYWIHEFEDSIIFAVGDCTGHGVPGAMVSMVCHEALNKVIKELGIVQPNKILDKVTEIVVSTFENDAQNLNDGMDIAICKLSNSKLDYAGAHNPLWIFRKGEVDVSMLGQNIEIETPSKQCSLISIKGDKQPVGRYDHPKPFKSHSIELVKGDSLFLFSDGFVDQFGGEKGKKFKTSNLKKLLFEINDLTMEEQHNQLELTFNDWKGPLEQVDDVCVMGVKF